MQTFLKGLIGALCLAVPATVLAQDAPQGDGWQFYKLTLIPESKIQIGTSGEVIFAQAEDRFGDDAAGSVAFMCLNQELMATMTYEAVTAMGFTMLWDNPKLRNARAELVIDGEGQGYHGFTRSRANKMLLPQDRKDTKRLYNAVLRGSDVRLRYPGAGDPVPLHLPEVNDTFRNFGSECGIGLYGKGRKQKA